ncbi:hypothetical protein Bca52824_012180 [Brassica carinata]|uniref:4a-hydroxytetrahydrobiopterin dehydratase n=1 Tax=Brassica carinata TaxID=52824 RepID=A0A8X8B204_BRACI|nr:hypothetical protein Bca52824_012180 [Brassica carinata]
MAGEACCKLTPELFLSHRFLDGIWLVTMNNVKIDIWTHVIGGLTDNDFILAAKINELEVEDFLRTKKKVSK